MRIIFLITILAMLGSGVSAAEKAQCDATPFTLGKPAAKAPKTEFAEAKASPTAVQPAPRKAPPKPKARVFAPCKDKHKKIG